tara:strand:- start:41482 stop:42885 length:1404 start_codon:yes stop_codon:yes gene_type:complete
MKESLKGIATAALVFALSAEAFADAEPRTGLETDFKVRLGGFAEGERDLGAGNTESTEEGFLDGQAVLHWQFSPKASVFFRGQGFVPTDELVITDENAPRNSDSYLGVRELWADYRGLTSFPGEVIRVGLQRLRDPDGQWFDRDIESIRWIFDTTLLQGDLGVAESFRTWRTDGSEIPTTDRDRAYLYGRLGSQIRPGHFVGARAIHGFDHSDPAEEAASNRADPKLDRRQYTWVDFYAHSNYYAETEKPGFSYWVDLSVLSGTREDYQGPTATSPAFVGSDSVLGWSGDLGLRWRLPTAYPIQVGGALAYGSGSDDGQQNNRYEQTGLHSNRSRYTGTRSILYRYNEAYQPDIGNMRVGSVYASIPQERWDASFVHHWFTRNETRQGVITDGIDVQPLPGLEDLGEGNDLVVAWYFGAPRTTTLANESEDNRSSLRLRASQFSPGRAYGSDVDDQYRVTMELTLWY